MPGVSVKPSRSAPGRPPGRTRRAAPAENIRARASGSRARRGRRVAPVQMKVGLAYAGADGEDAVAGQHAAPREQPPLRPVGKAELRLRQGVLAVDPAGEAVADEGRVDALVEA